MQLKTIISYGVIVAGMGVLLFSTRQVEPPKIEDTSLHEDMAILAFHQGNYLMAKKYASSRLMNQIETRMRLQTELLSLIDQGLSMEPQRVDQGGVFKKLVSIERLEDVAEEDSKYGLLLAKVSVTSGFVAWNDIAKGLEKQSIMLETEDKDFSALLYQISQFRVDDV